MEIRKAKTAQRMLSVNTTAIKYKSNVFGIIEEHRLEIQ